MRQITPSMNDIQKWGAYTRQFEPLFYASHDLTVTDRSLALFIRPSDACLKVLQHETPHLRGQVMVLQIRAYKLTEPYFGSPRFWGAKVVASTSKQEPAKHIKHIGWLKAGRLKDLFWSLNALQSKGEVTLLKHL